MQTNNSQGPLTGYRVLEIGSTIAGPFCGRLLADFGAEVIKVEAPGGDPVRTMGKHFHGRSLYAASIFRNKALISVDLQKPDGQDIIRNLAKLCDVIVENFRPGRLEEWGISYHQLSNINPTLIMVRISGFGQTGPYSRRPAYGVTSEAVSGLRHLTGDPDRPPSRVAVSMTDYITGLYAAFGTVLALLAREKTGHGQCIDAALYECAFSFMEPWIAAYEKLGHVQNRTGSRLPSSAPNNLYVSDDQQFIHVTAMNDTLFKRLLTVMGRSELVTDPRFSSAAARTENYQAIDDLIAQWTSCHTIAELETILGKVDVPAARVYTIADIFGDPHYRERGSIVRASDDDLNEISMAVPVPRMSETPGVVRHAGRRIGQDTRQVLTELLNFSANHIDALIQSGAIACDLSDNAVLTKPENSINPF